MQKTRDDGGPAYPGETLDMAVFNALRESRGVHEATKLSRHPGMTLRDWLAGQALVGLGQWTPIYAADGSDLPQGDMSSAIGLRHRADWAYAQADAMLAARKAHP